MKDMVNLRIVALCSNVAFIAYALVLNLTPILALHVILLPLNGWRLAQALRAGRLVQHSPTRAWPWSRPLSRIANRVVPTMRSIILMAMVYMSLAGAFAAPPENIDPSIAPWFNSLSAPDGTACCAIADCRRTMSRQTAEAYEALIDDAWVTVPWDRVLPKIENPTGQAVVCTAPRTKIILCFVRPPDS